MSTPPPNVNTSDLMSLELLMNKSHYKQYLAKTNPYEHKKAQEHYDKYQKYKPKITKLVQDYIKYYNSPALYFNKGNTDLQEIFSAFTKKAIIHFESVEHNEDDADQLFDISPNLSKKQLDYEEEEEDHNNEECDSENENEDDCLDDIEDTEYNFCVNESQTEEAIGLKDSADFSDKIYHENTIQPLQLPSLFTKKNTSFDIDLLLSNRRKFKKIL